MKGYDLDRTTRLQIENLDNFVNRECVSVIQLASAALRYKIWSIFCLDTDIASN